MSFRSYDWECTQCGCVAWHLVDVPHGELPPRTAELPCLECDEMTEHDKVISLVAAYMGEKMLNPIVHGGKFDTAGRRELPSMPAFDNLPPDASISARKERVDAYRERFQSNEWREMKRERAAIRAENAQKRQRLAAIARGDNINMRRDKCAGDPKVTA